MLFWLSTCVRLPPTTDNLLGVEKFLRGRHAHEEGEAEHLTVRMLPYFGHESEVCRRRVCTPRNESLTPVPFPCSYLVEYEVASGTAKR